MRWLDALKRRLGIGREETATPEGAGEASAGVAPVSCQEALRRLFEYLDGELEEVSEAEVARHMEVCSHCYPRLAFERSFLEALGRVRSGDEAPPELRRRVLDLLSREGFA